MSKEKEWGGGRGCEGEERERGEKGEREGRERGREKGEREGRERRKEGSREEEEREPGANTDHPSPSPSLSQFPDAGGATYQTLQNNLSVAAAALNVVGSEVVAASRGTLEQKSEATAKFGHCFEELLTTGLTLAGASKVGGCCTCFALVL